jgi:hypothetical protein
MPASLIKADGSRTPIGKLAAYSISKSNIPTNPSDSSGQIPTFSATVTNVGKDSKTHLGDPVVLTDSDRQDMEGAVVSVGSSAKSGLTKLDMNTVFERLNTEQTTYPVYTDSTFDVNMAPTAITQWLLMAGVPKFRVPGNLQHYITNAQVGYSSRSDATWVMAPSSEWPADHSRYKPTYGSNLGRIEVNRAQSTIWGMGLNPWHQTDYNTEVLVGTWNYRLNNTATYRLMQVGRVITLSQRTGDGAYTVLATLTVPVSTTVVGDFVYVLIKAHPTVASNISVTIRAIGYDQNTGQNVVYESTTASVASTLRTRPELRTIDFGYDTAQAGIDMSPSLFHISEGDVIPFEAPHDQISITLDSNAKPLTCVPGFTGNVWEKLKELCSLCELDISFGNDRIDFAPRKFQRAGQWDNVYKPMLPFAKSNVSESANQREKARTVEVVYREQPKQNTSAYYNTELWRADSVYTVEPGEKLVEVVQTEGTTFLTLNQPVPVGGVPVPYTNSYGAYVVTGNDGFIVDPQWWKDNGGSLTVQPTRNAGEIEITIQAPAIQSSRAPYRISEGVADRPALYVFGEGLKLGKEKTVRVYTGNPDASEEVGTKFDSVFVTDKLTAFNAGHKIAVTYGTGDSTLSYDIPRKETSEFNFIGSALIFSANVDDHNVYYNGSAYRAESYSIGPSITNVSKAVRYNTHRILNGEYATGKTIAQQNAMNAGKKIKDTNLAPLPPYLS